MPLLMSGGLPVAAVGASFLRPRIWVLKLPFEVACSQAPSGKSPDLADLLDVAEHRLDRVGSLA